MDWDPKPRRKLSVIWKGERLSVTKGEEEDRVIAGKIGNGFSVSHEVLCSSWRLRQVRRKFEQCKKNLKLLLWEWKRKARGNLRKCLSALPPHWGWGHEFYKANLRYSVIFIPVVLISFDMNKGKVDTWVYLGLWFYQVGVTEGKWGKDAE